MMKPSLVPIVAHEIVLITTAHLVGGWDNTCDCKPMTPEMVEKLIIAKMKRYSMSREAAMDNIHAWGDRCKPRCPQEDCDAMMKSIQISKKFLSGEPIELATADFHNGTISIHNKVVKITGFDGWNGNECVQQIADYYDTNDVFQTFHVGPYAGWKMVAKQVIQNDFSDRLVEKRIIRIYLE